MKKLSLLSALLCATTMMFAAETVLFEQTYPGSPSTFTNAYNKTFTMTTGGYTLTYENINNGTTNGGWTAVRAGSKNGVSTASVTSGQIAAAVTKVVVNFTEVDASKTNSLSLKIASDAAFSADVQTVSATIAAGAVTFTVATAAENKYYKIVIDMAQGSANGFNRFDNIKFYQNVADVAATAVALDQATMSLEQYREGVLTATLTPDNATTPVVWTSSDEAVATVVDGKVTAVATGTATITATAGTGITATCAVTVVDAVVITCADAAQKGLSVSANEVPYQGGKYVVRGYVTGIKTAYSAQNNNISFWMADAADGGQVLQAFRCVPEAADKLPVEGNYVEVIGQLTKYGTTPEIAAGCTCRILPTPVTSLDNLSSGQNVRKVVENGQLYIIRDGVRYTVAGQMVK